MTDEIEVVASTRCVLGETPSWAVAEQALYWADIKGQKLYRLDPASEQLDVWSLPWRATAPVPATDGRTLLATTAGVGLFDRDSGDFERLATLDEDRPGNRPNEGKCDRHGRYWVGTIDDAEQVATGRLYRIDADGARTRLLDGIGVSNTLAWTPDDRSLYFGDSMEQTVYVFDYDAAAGTVAGRRPFVSTRGEVAAPDGSAIDADGFLWNCQWDGHRVVRYAPDGRIDRVVEVPVSRPTSCCFGGPALDTLFITTATVGLDSAQLEAQPLAGNLLALRPGVRGLPEVAFGGSPTRAREEPKTP